MADVCVCVFTDIRLLVYGIVYRRTYPNWVTKDLANNDKCSYITNWYDLTLSRGHSRNVEFVGGGALEAGLVMKAQNDWRDVGRPQVAVHRNCHFSTFRIIFLKIFTDRDTVPHLSHIIRCAWGSILPWLMWRTVTILTFVLHYGFVWQDWNVFNSWDCNQAKRKHECLNNWPKFT